MFLPWPRRAGALIATFAITATIASSAAAQTNAPSAPSAAPLDSFRVSPDSFLTTFETSKGPIVIMVRRPWSPLGADRFYYLVKHGYYDENRFFRMAAGFVVQFGLPARPELIQQLAAEPFEDDTASQSNVRGTLTFAHGGPGTRQNQLFFNLADNTMLDGPDGGNFTPFGMITEGMDILDQLNGEYGEEPAQDMITSEGNAYLEREFPRLDFIRAARVTREWR